MFTGHFTPRQEHMLVIFSVPASYLQQQELIIITITIIIVIVHHPLSKTAIGKDVRERKNPTSQLVIANLT